MVRQFLPFRLIFADVSTGFRLVRRIHWRSWRSGSIYFLVCFLLGFDAGGHLALGQSFPPLSSRIIDQAGVLSENGLQNAERILQEQEAQTGYTIAIVIMNETNLLSQPSDEPAGRHYTEDGEEILLPPSRRTTDYISQLVLNWGFGFEEGERANLLLLVINTAYLEMATYSLGWPARLISSDDLSLLLGEAVIPHVRGGDIESGVLAAADVLSKRLLRHAPHGEGLAASFGDTVNTVIMTIENTLFWLAKASLAIILGLIPVVLLMLFLYLYTRVSPADGWLWRWAQSGEKKTKAKDSSIRPAGSRTSLRTTKTQSAFTTASKRW